MAKQTKRNLILHLSPWCGRWKWELRPPRRRYAIFSDKGDYKAESVAIKAAEDAARWFGLNIIETRINGVKQRTK